MANRWRVLCAKCPCFNDDYMVLDTQQSCKLLLQKRGFYIEGLQLVYSYCSKDTEYQGMDTFVERLRHVNKYPHMKLRQS